MLIHRKILLLMPALLAGTCAPKESGPPADFTGFVRGQARVIAVDQNLGRVLLEFSGRQVYGYWEVQTNLAQGGSVMNNGPLKPPVANYHEPLPSQQLFPAAAGDVIAFVGFQTGQEILLRGVEILPH